MTQASTPADVVSELNRQFNQELGAAHQYLGLSLWCETHGLAGFAAFFAQQAAEERVHAGKIIQYLVARGKVPAVGAVPAPRQDFTSLLDVVRHAQALELANTRGIHGVYEAALAARDYPAQVLMHWFISEQVEEEAWCAGLVEKVHSASCAGSLSSLDRHLDKLRPESAGAATAG